MLSQSDAFDRSHRSDIVISAESSPSDGHIAACEDRYRSYNAETDMYLSFGGDWKRCML